MTFTTNGLQYVQTCQPTHVCWERVPSTIEKAMANRPFGKVLAQNDAMDIDRLVDKSKSGMFPSVDMLSSRHVMLIIGAIQKAS